MGENKENPPPIAEPLKWLCYQVVKEWHHLKAAWLASTCILALGFVAGYWFAHSVLLESEEGRIKFLETSTKGKESKIDELQKENEKLQRQNTELKSALAEFVAPLKKRTLILASQLNAFAQQHKADTDLFSRYNEYENRFQQRVYNTIMRLDESGQHSDLLNQEAAELSQRLLNFPSVITNLTVISKELERLANNLKE